ncbi:MAG TPA: ATP-binding protein [Thermoanaerobaculia bacterium]|nr:ATP-binding protein [Thermoanaerobaculia bacterium]
MTSATLTILLLDDRDGDAAAQRVVQQFARAGVECTVTRVADEAEFRAAQQTGSYDIALAGAGALRAFAALQQVDDGDRLAGLGRIASKVAHDFNNVLMAIQPFAEVIRRRAAADPHLTSAATSIVNSVARGRRITQDINRTTRVGETAASENNVPDFLRKSALELATVAGDRVKVQIAPNDAQIRATFDPAQIRQALANLVANARDAMPDGGTITISATVDADRVRITTRDTGAGIAPDVLPHIFDPLFTTRRSGIGLGLSVVRQLVAANGGTVEVESVPGEGTAFHIFLARMPSPRIMNTSVQRLVLIEDDNDVADGVSQMLALEGVRVDHVTTGGMAEEAVIRFSPDAVLLDLNLPDLDGTQVFERLNARWPQLPVVFCSGDVDTTRVLPYLESPNVRFLPKPYDIDLLLQALREMV